MALAFAFSLPLGGELAAQAPDAVLDDAMVPRGRVRVALVPIYTSWDSRFGRTAPDVTGREELGEDLTTGSAETLFPGTASLVSAIESMTGSPGYTPVLGETTGRVAKDVTRVEFGGHIGIFDWLTIGAVLPWTRTRTNVDLYFRPDTLTGDLGLNPRATAGGEVTDFLLALGDAEAAAQANATGECSASPGSPSCTAAQALADRTAAFFASAASAYAASPFFPREGSATAASLDAAVTTLDADLVAAGLPGIGVPMSFASEWVASDDFAQLAATSGFGVEGAPLGDVRPLWHAGDLELSASFRLLRGAIRDSAQTVAAVAYEVLGSILTRLPTGAIDHPDVFLDVATGDGQTDVEGRIRGEVVLAGRLGLRAGGRYGIQLPRTLIRRVAPPEQVLAPRSSRQIVEWDPGSYFGVEVAPSYRFSPELSLGAEYRAYRKYRDTYTLAGASVGAPVDPVVMQIESGVTVHHLAGILRYDTVARRMATGEGTPLQLHLRVQRAMAGGGGQTPVTTRFEFGLRLYRRFWGAP